MSKSDEKDNKDEYASKLGKEGLDYYAILGVDKDASSIAIKRAYQKKLAKYHPDKIPKSDSKQTERDE